MYRAFFAWGQELRSPGGRPVGAVHGYLDMVTRLIVTRRPEEIVHVYDHEWRPVARTDMYAGKILHINAGQALSVQYHNTKDETAHLLSGELIYRVKIGDKLEDMRLERGQSFRIAPGTVHQMEAVTDCDVLEASTGEVDDVVRLQDRYGREGTSAP